MAGRQQVGYLTEDMIGLLGAGFTPGRIFLGESNEAHINQRMRVTTPSTGLFWSKFWPLLTTLQGTRGWVALSLSSLLTTTC